MFERLPYTAMKATLAIFFLLTPPVSDAVEQRIPPIEPETDSALIQVVSESWRKGTIDAAYLLNKNLESRTLDVSVSKSTATLNGIVSSPVNKSLAQEIALSVEGIDHVINNINVIPSIEQKVITTSEIKRNKKDILLTARINQKLLTHKHLKTALIKVHSNNGIVELSGNSPSDAVKDLAYYLAKNVPGVKSVDNKIKVRLYI